MAEYIDKNKIKESLVWHDQQNMISGMEDILDIIDEESVADVAPVKHGKWRWNQNGMDWGLGAWECSECACRNNNLPMNEKINPLVFSGSKYCPNCGAKMDLEE